MQITRCPKGHFYDADKCPTCPVCTSGETADTADLQKEPFETPPVCTPPQPIDRNMELDMMFREVGSTVRLVGIASITYDRHMGFEVTPENENLVQLNGKPLRNKILLREDDELTLGGTRVILTRPYMEAYRRIY